jgi:flagellar biosynthetic protein FliO
MKKIILITLVLLVSAFFSVYGQDGAEASAEPDFTDETTILLDAPPDEELAAGSGSFFSIWDIVKVILILAAVILVIYAIFYGLKKAGGGKYQDDGLIRLLGSRSLSQNGAVHLIEVGAKYYLIGSADGSVTHLADIDDKESVDGIMLKNKATTSSGKTFGEFFNSMFGRSGPNNADLTGKIANNNKIVKDQIERLKKM